MIISRKCYTSKYSYTCGDCCKLIPAGVEYIRLFGMAERGDQPYEMMLHLRCDQANKYAEKCKLCGLGLDLPEERGYLRCEC